jgi:hypothetical protein
MRVIESTQYILRIGARSPKRRDEKDMDSRTTHPHSKTNSPQQPPIPTSFPHRHRHPRLERTQQDGADPCVMYEDGPIRRCAGPLDAYHRAKVQAGLGPRAVRWYERTRMRNRQTMEETKMTREWRTTDGGKTAESGEGGPVAHSPTEDGGKRGEWRTRLLSRPHPPTRPNRPQMSARRQASQGCRYPCRSRIRARGHPLFLFSRFLFLVPPPPKRPPKPSE